MPTTTDLSSPDLSRLHDRLTQETRALVSFDRGRRALYATDASLYQIEPVGVVVPRTVEDVIATVRIAAEEKVAIVPRGAATSLSGQTIGAAIVIDFSKYLNRIGIVDRNAMTVRVEPGVVLDQLNAHLKPLGLMFGPDVSTSDRATIGGMIGNNSAGARSLRYGKTVDHVRALEVVLADGTAARLGPVSDEELAAICQEDGSLGRVHRAVRDTVAAHRQAIIDRFPHILRRVSGYNLDEFVPGLPVRPVGWVEEPWRFNLARLIVGSEGSLAVVTAAELKVVPIPAEQGLVVLSFATIPAALERLAEIVATGPVAVEMLDRMILDLAAENPLYSHYLNFADGRPAAVLAAQFYADSRDELAARADDLARRFEGCPGVLGVRKSLTNAAKDDFWKVRKAGFSLLMAMVGDAKPIAFVEDTAVSPDRLPVFYDRFRAVRRAAWRPRGVLRARRCRLSAHPTDHQRQDNRRRGDAAVDRPGSLRPGGRVRRLDERRARRRPGSQPLEPQAVRARGLRGLAAGQDSRSTRRTCSIPTRSSATPIRATICGSARSTTRTNLRKRSSTSPVRGASPAPSRCVRALAACRKTATGTMCPSYMVTRDEMHSTRGRANALRLVMTGELPSNGSGLGNDTLFEALDLCLQCKACKSECPSQVDMAKLKAEFLHQYYASGPRPLSHLLMGQIFRLNPIGSALAPLANATLRNPVFKWLLEKTAGIDRRRTLPTFVRNHFRKWFNHHVADPRSGRRGSVVLLDDCFTTYNNPDVGIAAVQVLEASGYRVVLAGLRCCGRPAISKGLLKLGRELGRENYGETSAPCSSGHLDRRLRAKLPGDAGR